MTRTVTLDAAASPRANAILTEMLLALQAMLRLPPTWSAAHSAQLGAAIRAYDAYIQHVVTAHPMTCRRGCTACCHDNPRGVSGVEGRWLGEWIDGQPDGAALRARFGELAARGLPAEAWRAARVPCPLLDDQGSCRAYFRRPLACRAFHALTPAEWCDPDDPRYSERVNPHLDPPAILQQFFAALSHRLALGEPMDLHHSLGAPPG